MSRIDWALAGAGVALGLAAMAVDHLIGDDPGLEDPPAFLISAAIILAITTLLFGRVVRRARDPSRASLIVALLAVASLPLIWLGVRCSCDRQRGAVARDGRVHVRRDRQALDVIGRLHELTPHRFPPRRVS